MQRLDDLENGYRIWQDPEGFCYGVDAVLLAHYATLKDGDRVLDMGTGTGAIPLIMKAIARDAGFKAHFTGIEIQKAAADLAVQSAALNGLENDIHFIQGDIKEAAGIFGAASFSLVTCNPPYMIGSHGLVSAASAKAAARHEIFCTLEDILTAAEKLLEVNGRFAMVHRPFRLAEIITGLTAHHLEPKRMRLVYPFADREPTMVLIEAVRGGRPRMEVGPPLVIYEKDSRYTDELLEIYGINH
ncbi:MAG TPA: tRNA1(Val) (adenine(37)-N6)-methyltransferase [Lachnospiraceae bacterium]|nr:tRNA1(Val) (adenine(37)-N6)-methyltransferase [Lachnospiraceae bacterium]